MGFPDLPRPKQASFDRVLKDSDDAQSVVNLVSPEVAKCIVSMPDSSCDLTEEELEEKFPDPTSTTMQLRKMFWLEFDRALDNRMKMDMSRVYVGVCSRQGFYKLIQNEHQLAWILSPPKEYLIETEELLSIGLKQIREIMKLPLKNPMGFVDTKLAEVKLKAVMMLDMRLKGAYVQRQMNYNKNENTNTNVNVNVEMGTEDQALLIDEKIQQLEQEIAEKERKLTTISPTKHLEDLQHRKVERASIEEAEFTEVKDA